MQIKIKQLIFTDKVDEEFIDNNVFNINSFQDCYKLMCHEVQSEDEDDEFESMAVNIIFRYSDILKKYETEDNSFLVEIKIILVNLTNILRKHSFEVKLNQTCHFLNKFQQNSFLH